MEGSDDHRAPGLRQWLETPRSFEVLLRVARQVLRTAKSRGLLSVLFHEDHHRLSEKELVEEIRAELAAFLLEKEKAWDSAGVFAGPHPEAYIRTAFLRHLVSRARMPNADQRRHLYRRLTEVLRTGDAFTHRMDAGGHMAYTMAPAASPTVYLAEEDLGDIAFPFHRVDRQDYDAINRRKVLLELAAYFWKTACSLWGGRPVWVPLKALVDWIFLHVPIRTRAELPAEYAGPGPVDQGHYDPERIRHWASLFAARLTKREKAVFYLHYGRRMELRQMAEQLGYKGSSGPAYPLEQCKRKLKGFLIELPWLSPPDLNEEAFALFRETLLASLKDTVSTP